MARRTLLLHGASSGRGQVGGSAGCNQYGGEYKRFGRRLTVGMPATKEIYRLSRAWMNQEQAARPGFRPWMACSC